MERKTHLKISETQIFEEIFKFNTKQNIPI